MKLLNYFILISLCSQVVFCAPTEEKSHEISIIHFNDFHARYEETSIDSGLCKSHECIGGFSRLYQTTMDLLEERPDSILLNAGDNFEGTLWYNIHKWNVTQYFLNKLPLDAATLGNHEFDDEMEGLVPFLERLNFPVVAANIDASQEPSIEGWINKSVVIERNGLKIGIIGVVLSTLNELADVGKLILLDESKSVNAEAERLVREEGVFTNIVLSHCGYDVEKEIARKSTSKISVIVGAHSHSFLFTGEPVPGPDIPVGPYPTITKGPGDKTVLVVQASAYSKYLGHIAVLYNNNGDVIDWKGAPIFLDNNLPQSEEMNRELLPWKEAVDKQGGRIIGRTLVRLDQSRCAMAECLLGNFITDAMIFGYVDSSEEGAWSEASIAIIHAGGLRSGIDVGNITFNEIVTAQPFENTIDIGEILGRDLKEVLESSVGNSNLNLLQVSGMNVVYNLSRQEGSRVTSLKIRCWKCSVPVYDEADLEATYRIILPSFLANGGSGFTLFPQYLKNRKIGPVDIDLFVRYVEQRSPIFQEIQDRVQILH